MCRTEVRTMHHDLTNGNITRSLLWFAFPIMVGNLLQQFYNVVDTLIVGQFLGKDALAAVGSSYSLMTFLTSILLGLCMGSGVAFSIYYGKKDSVRLKNSIFLAFCMIGGIALLITGIVFSGMDMILHLLQVPADIYEMMREYLWMIFWGILATFLYNFISCLLRAAGNSVVPLVFLGISAVLNIGLDLLFVVVLKSGVQGAAEATVISQYVSGVGLLIYTLLFFREFCPRREDMRWRKEILKEILHLSSMTCIQQSVMNFGILMVQGLVNSFGSVVMAAFSVAVKIDSFSYMPVQDFGNAFSTFVAQNYGAGRIDRIKKGIKKAVSLSVGFSLCISAVVFFFARPLMTIFVNAEETAILSAGVEYLRIEGAFYCGIGCLFLLYGYYRAVKKPGMSLILTVIALGTRVVLAYVLSAIPQIGVTGIWWSVPVGWGLADLAGFLYYKRLGKV